MFDKVLSWFIYVWLALALAIEAFDIARLMSNALTWESGLQAVQHKWFGIQSLAELVLISPALGAYYWREKRRQRIQRQAKQTTARVLLNPGYLPRWPRASRAWWRQSARSLARRRRPFPHLRRED
jgi:hypothetical protein